MAWWAPVLGSVVGGLLGGAGRGSQGSTQNATSGTERYNATTTNTPYQPFAQGYDYALAAAQNAYEGMNRDPYTGKVYARPGGLQKEAAGLTEQFARRLIGESGLNDFLAGGGINAGGGGGMPIDMTGYDQLLNLGVSQLEGKYLSPETNPFLQAAIDMAQGRTSKNFTEQVLPQLGSQAQLSGAYGGGRQGVVEARAAETLQQTLADIATQMAYENYANERAIQQGSGGLLKQAQDMQAAVAANARANASAANAAHNAKVNQMLQAISMLGGVGAQQQQWKQNRMDAAMQLELLNRQLTNPLPGLGELGSILGLGGGFGTQTQAGTSYKSGSATQQQSGSMLADILKGAAGGANLGWLLGNQKPQAGTTLPGIPLTYNG